MSPMEYWGRYEYTDDKSNKFWEIEPRLDGMADVRWGRIGSEGKSQVVARDIALSRARQKLSKGYQMVEDFSNRKVAKKKPANTKKKTNKPKTNMWDELAKAGNGD